MSAAPSVVDVVRTGVCVGCGACTVASQGRIPMALNEIGAYQAELAQASADDLRSASAVCPFSNDAPNEDELARRHLSVAPHTDVHLGRYLSVYAARVEAGEDVTLSSSGGLTSWILIQLMQAGLIDGVIHVAAGERNDGRLFEYTVSTSVEALRTRRKSNYYATTFAEALMQVKGDGRRYAFVGVPCYVKAARALKDADAVLASQLSFFVGLVCGHLKSPGFAELLAWQVGVPPGELAAVDFRIKSPGRTAGDYSFGAMRQGEGRATSNSAHVSGPHASQTEPAAHTAPTRSLLGGNWGHAMFQLKACDFCDDIFAEVADVALGDAWLPEYENDWRGTNVIVNRHDGIEDLLQRGGECGALFLRELPVAQAVASQAGNVRHRWDGLSVRLADAAEAGQWVPHKRIQPGSRPQPALRQELIRLRQRLSAQSHVWFRQARQRGSLEHFTAQAQTMVTAMDDIYRRINGGETVWQKWKRRARKLWARIN